MMLLTLCSLRRIGPSCKLRIITDICHCLSREVSGRVASAHAALMNFSNLVAMRERSWNITEGFLCRSE
jgi:hypothetical protein